LNPRRCIGSAAAPLSTRLSSRVVSFKSQAENCGEGLPLLPSGPGEGIARGPSLGLGYPSSGSTQRKEERSGAFLHFLASCHGTNPCLHFRVGPPASVVDSAASSEIADRVGYGEPLLWETPPAEPAANRVLLAVLKQRGGQVAGRAGRSFPARLFFRPIIPQQKGDKGPVPSGTEPVSDPVMGQ
jgi:hypothetical protein